jgi:integrase/recombinase XerD
MACKQRVSSNTVAAYRSDLSQFIGRVAILGVVSWEQVDEQHVVGFYHWLQESHYADSTVARKLAAVRSFFHYLTRHGVLEDDPSLAVPFPQVPRSQPRTLPAESVTRMLNALSASSAPRSLRDRALLELLCTTGMRVGEVVGLTVRDVDLAQGTVCCQGDGDHTRLLALPPQAVEALRGYLERGRPRLLHGAEADALFVNRSGQALTRQGAWLIVKGRAEAAGIGCQVTPCVLRHSFAVRSLQGGASLQEVQEQLGHTNIATTQVYQDVGSRK